MLRRLTPRKPALKKPPSEAAKALRLTRFGQTLQYASRHLAVTPAGIAQLVERNLAKVEVAGSNPVSRSSFSLYGSVAEWLCSGLQIRVRRFDSDPSLHMT